MKKQLSQNLRQLLRMVKNTRWIIITSMSLFLWATGSNPNREPGFVSGRLGGSRNISSRGSV